MEAGDFSARTQHKGRRAFFNLGTSNKAQAAAIARSSIRSSLDTVLSSRGMGSKCGVLNQPAGNSELWIGFSVKPFD